MKRPGLLEGVAVALVASLGTGVLFSVLSTAFHSDFLLRLLIALTGLLYMLYLLRRSGEKVGRVITPVLWLTSTAAVWLMGLSLPLYLMAHLGFIWLIRSLYFHSSLISALADSGLVLFGIMAAIWAVLQSGSLFLGVWCFFLVQALFAAIPGSWRRSSKTGIHSTGGGEDRFHNAYRTAQAALTKLSSQH